MCKYRLILFFKLCAVLMISSVTFSATPNVVETHPPNGAVGVRPDFDRITIKYDQPINAWGSRNPAHRCFYISSEWASNPVPGDYWWGDRIIIPRDIVAHIPGDPDWIDLPFGTTINVTINPSGASPDHCFCDQEGNLLPTHQLQFTIRSAAGDSPVEPQVISANPPDGATGVDPGIRSFSITFSEAMAPNDKGYFTFNFGPTDLTWSEDGKTLTFTRQDTSPIPDGYDVVLILNYDEDDRFRDLDGHVLKEHTYTFRVEGDLQGSMEENYDMTYLKVPADPNNGFYWPYYLGIPNEFSGLTTLLVVPNNSGRPCDDQRFHEIMAWWDLYGFSRLASNIQVPMLVPVFPRTIGAYLQNLSGIAFQSDLLSTSLERIDLQLLAMIDDARQRLSEWPLYLEDKIFMTGFSASGQFSNGFAIVHPDCIKAAAIGGGETAIAPVASWDEQELRYFWGIADLEELTEQPFDLDAFVEIPLFIYLGNLDTNYINCPECFAQSEEIYTSVNANSTFKLYTNMGHWINEEAWTDLESFFSDISPDPTGIWVTISGTVSFGGQPVSSMVLANGQYMFTSSEDGLFSLTVPLNAEGQIIVYTYAGRLAPQKQVIDPEDGIDMHIALEDNAGDQAIDVTYNVEAIDSKWVRLTGTVTYNGSPASAMVLANGQYMFTSSDDGQFDLETPLSAQGKITLYCYAGRLQPYKHVFSP